VDIIAGERGDIADINHLYAAVGWSEPGSLRPRDHYLLAREGQRLVGAALFWLDDDIDLLPDVWLERFGPTERVCVHEIVVARSHRRKGIGRMLLVAVAHAASDRGIEYLWAWPSPRGNQSDVRGRLEFFASCAMEILSEDADHVVAVGRAAAVANLGSSGASRQGK
jgi:GNAT superfamily N-acetyltransferase